MKKLIFFISIAMIFCSGSNAAYEKLICRFQSDRDEIRIFYVDYDNRKIKDYYEGRYQDWSKPERGLEEDTIGVKLVFKKNRIVRKLYYTDDYWTEQTIDLRSMKSWIKYDGGWGRKRFKKDCSWAM
jgi:hypothetical protein